MYHAIVGTYTKEGGPGMVSYAVADPGEGFDQRDAINETDPSYFAIHPSEPVIVAVNERERGALASYRLDPSTGQFTFLDRATTGSADPCHVAIGPRGEYAVVANYSGGAVTLFSIEDDGRSLERVDLQRHEGSSTHPDRQTAPHPHSAYFIDESLVYVPDLGVDRLYVYEIDRQVRSLTPRPSSNVTLHDGAGPRHLATRRGETGYLLNELDSSLTVFDIADPADPTPMRTLSTLPESDDVGENIAADVHVDPTGDYVLASNRGHDSLAVYDIASDPDSPRLLTVTASGGRWPRNFAFSPRGEYVFCAHQHSDDVVTFAFDTGDGRLSQAEVRIDVSAPVCLQFV